MDVTKLFDLPQDKMAPLASDRLDAMIDTALAQPQLAASPRIASNENQKQWRKFIAVAAVFLLVIATSLQLYETVPTGSNVSINGVDPYDEVSDLLMMETFTISSAN